MTERQLRRLVDRWVPRLGLDGWVIEITITDLEDDNRAECEPSQFYRRAVLRFAPHADRWASGLEYLVVHELLHVATRDIRQIGSLGLDGQVHPYVQDVHEQAHRRALEGEIDRLAVALVATWPS